mgnify:CR=1 FL=1
MRKIYREANKEKINAAQAEYHKINKEKINARHKAYHEENPEKRKEYYRNYKDKINTRCKQWREKNKEKIAAYDRQYEKDNKERILKRKRAYAAANKEKIKVSKRVYREANKEKLQMYVQQYEFKRSRATPPWFEKKKVSILFKRRNELNELWQTNFHVDHIIPIGRQDESAVVCGLHCHANLQLLDKSINSSKGSKYPWEYEDV